MIAPWRGEREWVPVSNPAICRVVGMRKDGRVELARLKKLNRELAGELQATYSDTFR